MPFCLPCLPALTSSVAAAAEMVDVTSDGEEAPAAAPAAQQQQPEKSAAAPKQVRRAASSALARRLSYTLIDGLLGRACRPALLRCFLHPTMRAAPPAGCPCAQARGPQARRRIRCGAHAAAM
jgi:hypothetical protein